MTNAKKFWLGVLTFAPLPLMALYIYSFFQLFMRMSTIENMGTQPQNIFEDFGKMFIYIAVAAIISIITMIIFIMDIVKNKKFQNSNSNMQIVWILIVILLSTLGIIVYYFVEIFPRKEGEDYHTPDVTDRIN